MRNSVDRLVWRMRVEYGAFLGLVLLMIVLYETQVFVGGSIVGNGRMEYLFGVVSVMLTIILIPLSLKFFPVLVKRKVDKSDRGLEEKCCSYLLLSRLRLLAFAIVTFFNLIVYYEAMTSAGMLLIAVAASFFCVPDNVRVYNDLNLEREKK